MTCQLQSYEGLAWYPGLLDIKNILVNIPKKKYPGKRPQTVGGAKETRLVLVMKMTMTHR